ncbi:ANT(4')-I family aminoglycoside nucleotidyltransferase [Brevibacillus agri]|uniref:ANT(4')-I family aminoglycoside nucleotidyltransferase n=1 Tax=Brevibacillus agri TaxID=51101 RepID=UPI0024C0E05D|nr:ANT(4')-I family aminoglycoside nucleotidyltransferase [Brevibacillus agri]MED4570518.1 ANT(4')-I family aminoglycoside nucleotidyltransferase [Brevibacillus agri]WHX29582.1 ANT(4')-I family aminoglycoside nucleotidyltransferase [Brevibacillus agri]
MNMNGPVNITRNERLQTCQEIAARLHEVYGAKILAIGVYGSVARGTDGPFSDIEMFCVLEDSDEDVDFSHEWSAGPWKAEVNVLSANVLLHMAATVDEGWPLSHGAFFAPLALYDPKDFFPALKKAAQSPTQEAFTEAINGVLVGEMYEFIGKLRNAHLNGPHTYLPYLAMQFAQYGAMLLGLHHRTCYSTGAQVLPESLLLTDRPDGYEQVAKLVMSGELADPAKIVAACEQFWSGLHVWAAKHHYVIHTKRIPF